MDLAASMNRLAASILGKERLKPNEEKCCAQAAPNQHHQQHALDDGCGKQQYAKPATQAEAMCEQGLLFECQANHITERRPHCLAPNLPHDL